MIQIETKPTHPHRSGFAADGMRKMHHQADHMTATDDETQMIQLAIQITSLNNRRG